MPAVNLVRYSVSANDAAVATARAPLQPNAGGRSRSCTRPTHEDERGRAAIHLRPFRGMKPFRCARFSGGAHHVYPEYYYRTRGPISASTRVRPLGVDGAVGCLSAMPPLLAMTEPTSRSPRRTGKEPSPGSTPRSMSFMTASTRRLVPAKAWFTDPATNQVFQSGDEVVTYVARNPSHTADFTSSCVPCRAS